MSLSTEAENILRKRYNYKIKDIKTIDKDNNVFYNKESKTVIKIMSKEHNIGKMERIFPLLQKINKQFNNPENIASFVDKPIVFKDNKTMMFLIKDYGDSMDKVLLNQKKPREYNDVLVKALQMSKGLAILQVGGVNHRDVKPSNFILVDNVIKVIDFDISKEKRSQQQKRKEPTTTTTNNQGTRAYFSSKRMKYALFQPAEQVPIGFLDDSYSLGLVFLEMIAKNTKLQIIASKFRGAQGFRSNFEIYQKQLLKVLKVLKEIVLQMSNKNLGIYLLIKNLLCFQEKDRIDLMATYKFLFKLKNDKRWSQTEMEEYLIQETKLSQQRAIKNVSRHHEKIYKYIDLNQSLGQRVVKNQPIMVCVSYSNDALIIYNSMTQEYKKEYFDQKLQDGYGIALTNDQAYIMGGEDVKTGKVLDINLRCNLRNKDIKTAPGVIDDGRNLFAVSYAFNGNFIALSGGYKVHSKVAKNILIYHPKEQKWIFGPELKFAKINASACFTDTCFFTFGGFLGEHSQVDSDQKKIQYFLSNDIKNGGGQCHELMVRGNIDDSMSSYLTAAAGLTIHMTGENILLLGGLGDKFEEDYADGYILKIKGGQDIDDEEEYKHGDARVGEMVEIKEQMGITRSTFYSPAMFYDNKVYISFPDSNDKGARFLEGKYANEVLSFEEHWLNSLEI